MLDRRSFLKTGAAVIPVTTAFNVLGSSTTSAEEVAVGPVGASGIRRVALPARMAPLDPAEPWQKTIRREVQHSAHRRL